MDDPLKYKQLHTKVRAQNDQIEQLRQKVFALQEVLIKSNNLPVCDLDHSLASISPIVNRIFPDSNTTVIAFGGVATKFGMPPAEFLKSFTSRNVNTIFVKDFQQCWYQKGLLGLSTDVRTTVEILKRQIPDNQQNICTIGTSAGGYAAILFGVLMGANKIVAFSPQTIINKRVFNKFKSFDSRLNDIELGNEFTDLKGLLEKNKHTSLIHIHYSESHEIDKVAAERMQEFHNVELHPWNFAGHNVAGWLKNQGKLDLILDEITKNSLQ